ncbi:hypothetical protein BV22DRAFT_1101626 [Leucogyrophana mollusca]|uniref:Uncharacterized protein n=1 Tax=Leucogyrophana mollusca TaxID=85980 RepID=A0ACB8BXL5_9AGAM|nr:hypothetical protein BV22DRAFT_1101626 [Leucogyrophana mollusca]
MATTFESLPVELIAEIMGELDIESLITVSYLSRRLNCIASDSSLNPWRRPILRNMYSDEYEKSLRHLSVRSTVPRQNWIEILSLAAPTFLLFETTLPNMKTSEWEECFRRRFLPSWTRWKKDSWREGFLKVLHRLWHRSHTSCTTDESWTKYVVLNRSGSANELEAASRSFSPLAIFNEMKLQSNLSHLETRIRLVVDFADVRVIALGVLNRPRTSLTVNRNARSLLHPPGIEAHENPREGSNAPAYDRLTHPLPSHSHRNYPFYTPGGGDKRWLGSGSFEEEGLDWVGGLMLTAQLVGPHTRDSPAGSLALQDIDLVVGAGRGQFASFTWQDLLVIAPWMEERITKFIDGQGLGL